MSLTSYWGQRMSLTSYPGRVISSSLSRTLSLVGLSFRCIFQEVLTPTNILDLMTLCWSRDPNDRPSASEIESFAASPEFCSLYNAIMLDDQVEVVCASTLECTRRTEYENLYGTLHTLQPRYNTVVFNRNSVMCQCHVMYPDDTIRRDPSNQRVMQLNMGLYICDICQESILTEPVPSQAGVDTTRRTVTDKAHHCTHLHASVITRYV